VCLRLLPDSVTTVTRQHRGCNLNPGPSALESSTLTTLLPSHAYSCWVREFIMLYVYQLACKCTPRFTTVIGLSPRDIDTASSISSLRRLWTISHDVSPRRDDHRLKLTGYEAYATTWGETSTSAAAITRMTVTGSAITRRARAWPPWLYLIVSLSHQRPHTVPPTLLHLTSAS